MDILFKKTLASPATTCVRCVTLQNRENYFRIKLALLSGIQITFSNSGKFYIREIGPS